MPKPRSMFHGFDAKTWRMLGLGLELGLLIGGLTVGGYYLDRWLDSSPWLTLAGALLATLGGSYNFVKLYLNPWKRRRKPGP